MSEQEFQAKVLSELQTLRVDVEKLGTDVEKLQTDVEKLQTDVHKLQGDVSELATQVKNQEYKFEVYQRGTDAMVRMATTIIIVIIAAASIVVLASLSPAITTLVSAIAHQGN
ncbi:hypothetical protein RHJ63_05530 [Thermosynechococcus sp. JY1334]|uniref:hypothetical protein n=1 Tax=unclassified Thermosynechococcus TaxID=2622553 RepID=UPI002674192B|nr:MULTISPECIES: hypothetical protein [unclassified Thermosynechococcus]MDR7897770.1 hypothetical protein [Thermosynechococcus sp. JY1332]MDR7905169.1 hypothetical protein [Thermosynechococcus sp. JY1334]WKT87388.1 hypothetical protein QYC30_05505 [Thermosynechococcus sp. JY1339]WNC56330.1 hypothetical protein RHJ31_05490 [Thermosynechococcus sp. JY1331]